MGVLAYLLGWEKYLWMFGTLHISLRSYIVLVLLAERPFGFRYVNVCRWLLVNSRSHWILVCRPLSNCVPMKHRIIRTIGECPLRNVTVIGNTILRELERYCDALLKGSKTGIVLLWTIHVRAGTLCLLVCWFAVQFLIWLVRSISSSGFFLECFGPWKSADSWRRSYYSQFGCGTVSRVDRLTW